MGCIAAALALSGLSATATESVATRMEAAKAAHARGDIARAASELEAVIADLHGRLGKALAEFLPAPLASWQAEAPETQGLASAGGGFAVSRAYARDDASLNATLILDSPAVSSAALQFAANAPAQPNMRRVKIGGEDALLRWDATNRAGEIMLILGNRVLLQIEGDSLGSSDLLVDAAKGWNISGIRKYLAI
ncbi:hypothetical protein CU669_15895 [Paramagnetospirillum kuznetsovii]|uniref:Uncharacterized protein n=2 Tax=Paramagnetospirillum kuznetsovii TaxID=2053833 RepID=A0A364NV69_9PROT|nr:hypothetical protein CU669_15895 [Paramagnetospirillum kuznetsovii]